jgi:hypothetical protein
MIFHTQIVVLKLKKNIDIKVGPKSICFFLNIFYTAAQHGKLTVSLFLLDGKKIVEKNIDVSKGYNSIQLDSLAHLLSGTYVIYVRTDNDVKTENCLSISLQFLLDNKQA